MEIAFSFDGTTGAYGNEMKNSIPSHLTKVNPLKSLGALVSDWALIVFCFVSSAYFESPFVHAISVILIARTQLALAVLMHESAHGILIENRKINDIIGQIFTAAPLSISLFEYRKGHLQHHRAPMVKDDPVAVIFKISDYPISKKELVWRLIQDITSIAYFASVYEFLSGKHRNLIAESKNSLQTRILVAVSILSFHSILFGSLMFYGHAWLYLGLWILPSLTILQVFARIRAITEHAGYRPADDQRKNARSIVRPTWQTFFFGPHCIHYHIEHHQYVHVPFYHLQELHKILFAQGSLPPENLYSGYGKVLKDVTV